MVINSKGEKGFVEQEIFTRSKPTTLADAWFIYSIPRQRQSKRDRQKVVKVIKVMNLSKAAPTKVKQGQLPPAPPLHPTPHPNPSQPPHKHLQHNSTHANTHEHEGFLAGYPELKRWAKIESAPKFWLSPINYVFLYPLIWYLFVVFHAFLSIPLPFYSFFIIYLPCPFVFSLDGFTSLTNTTNLPPPTGPNTPTRTPSTTNGCSPSALNSLTQLQLSAPVIGCAAGEWWEKRAGPPCSVRPFRIIGMERFVASFCFCFWLSLRVRTTGGTSSPDVFIGTSSPNVSLGTSDNPINPSTPTPGRGLG
ncbi:uncharacterized protein LACBIDRAFT_294575 [Laccaria bicolor S238N-H82]|uniref:Predicted protein n=1 Tax=Laccaria bicolor (strain S238N-H82 / ATCC MYA-4686) TaxID=486041 RepID=B0DE41_LACBS|nr:uncharacterized protein LACBIDRAFT_294575 [Laccaria bicolor S238N-H82]EDR07201.1 predicted protein [Laccaria bicolor S238N-H82]|eukprot:XP_001882132.1 predicted protein [Laccaria bicolor S238N-H82]